MIEKSITLLQTSTDPDELATVAVALARGPQPEGHDALREQLQSPEFYYKLDTKKEYGDFGVPLRLNRIITALSENKAPSAHDVLVVLTQSSVYKSVNRRITMLISACAAVRPSPPEIVRFWDSYSQPETGFISRTISALVKNGSPPALALLEKKMADPKHEDKHKLDWMHRPILEHRNDPPLLECCLRMLEGGLSENLRPALVETLFDYRLREWFPGKRPTVPKPPPREEATEPAREQLRRIGEYALKNVELSDEQKETVQGVLEQLFEKHP